MRRQRQLACCIAWHGRGELLSRAQADRISSKGMQSGGLYRPAHGAHHGAAQGTRVMPMEVSQALTRLPLTVKAASELVLVGDVPWPADHLRSGHAARVQGSVLMSIVLMQGDDRT